MLRLEGPFGTTCAFEFRSGLQGSHGTRVRVIHHVPVFVQRVWKYGLLVRVKTPSSHVCGDASSELSRCSRLREAMGAKLE